MTVDKFKLNAAQTIAWALPKPPVGCTPVVVYIGRDDSGVGAIQVALANVTTPPTRETMRVLHASRKGKSNVQLIVGVVLGELVWLFGPDDRAEVIEAFPLNQGLRQLQSALNEPNALAAYTRLGQFRRSLDTTSLPGFTNNGLFASYHIRENVPKRGDWTSQCERAKQWLALRDENLIKALGFATQKTAGNALILTSGTPVGRAVAVLLEESEQFESASQRHALLSPVAWGLNVAVRQGVPWLILLRKDQIRLYPARDGVGVGQKSQVETYFEIDLAAIDVERSGLLALIFSAEALADQGTTSELLEGSHNFASRLGLRLRERIYEYVVPDLATSVAECLREQGIVLDGEGLALAYRLTLRILFRLLFQAYAEDRGLLPAGRNESYDANSLKSIARRFRDTPTEDFGDAQSLWFDLVQVWNAIDSGNKTWDVPAYNGGLFGTDPDLHPEGALIGRLELHDLVLGPVLQHLLIDDTEDGVRGPVDFRSLSVREFGTIYEGLLESSLSVATQDLAVDSRGAWIPAIKSDAVVASKGDVYFHSSSGERKATGSYFTPAIVVDHLIDRALDPALDTHLGRIKKHLDAGDEVAAARDFFDFRVADLAMGSGHFLVAAVDRIEAKMRIFLSERETQVPGITAELLRLANSAKTALGKDEAAMAEIEPAALLRRQIARRCIYGLDVNPLAVELSRLALWIHTFVPGLPMSSLDHGLVCANSLTGIGTIDEALSALSPDSPIGQFSIYEDVISENLLEARELLLDVANSDEAKKSEVREAAIVAQRARQAAEPTRAIFDAAVAARLGIVDTRLITDGHELIKIGRTSAVSEIVTLLNPAHLPFLFPEVFLRTRSGFDVILGNPPWEKAKVEVTRWWALRFPGLRSLPQGRQDALVKDYRVQYPDLAAEIDRDVTANEGLRKSLIAGPYEGIGKGDPDLYQAFAWRNWDLINEGGRTAFVAPRSLVSEAGAAAWRDSVFDNGEFEDVTLLSNTGRWVFDIHPQYTVAMITIRKLGHPGDRVNLSGPFHSRKEFLTGPQGGAASFDPQEFRKWGTGAAFPILSNAKDGEVYLQMKRHPRFDLDTPDLRIRAHREFDSSMDKRFFRLDEVPDGYWPLYKGESFDLWNPDTGKYYGGVDPKQVLPYLVSKRENQSTLRSSAFSLYPKSWISDNTTLPILHSRIAIRKITNRTNTRSLICALVPPYVATTDGAPYLLFPTGDHEDAAYILGVLSSLVLDWQARRTVEVNMNYHILYGLSIPRPDRGDENRKRIVHIAARLAARDGRFTEWAEAVGVGVGSVKSDSEKTDLIAELDAIVANLYGVDRDQLIHIFSTFHRGWDYHSRLNATLAHFDSLAAKNVQ